MVQNRSGLIVNISSYGGWQFIFNVPYAVGKSACDRMATDSAIDLKKENVAMVSLWPGAVKTETVGDVLAGSCKFLKFYFYNKSFIPLRAKGVGR